MLCVYNIHGLPCKLGSFYLIELHTKDPVGIFTAYTAFWRSLDYTVLHRSDPIPVGTCKKFLYAHSKYSFAISCAKSREAPCEKAPHVFLTEWATLGCIKLGWAPPLPLFPRHTYLPWDNPRS